MLPKVKNIQDCAAHFINHFSYIVGKDFVIDPVCIYIVSQNHICCGQFLDVIHKQLILSLIIEEGIKRCNFRRHPFPRLFNLIHLMPVH